MFVCTICTIIVMFDVWKESSVTHSFYSEQQVLSHPIVKNKKGLVDTNKSNFFSLPFSPGAVQWLDTNHRHLKIIDCLTAHVFFISTVNGRSKKKKEKKPILHCASSGHINKLEQSIFAPSISMIRTLNPRICTNVCYHCAATLAVIQSKLFFIILLSAVACTINILQS